MSHLVCPEDGFKTVELSRVRPDTRDPLIGALFEGRYQIQVFSGDSQEPRYVSDWFHNIITDRGLDYLGTGFTHYCFVGTSGAAESPTNTQITNPVGSGQGYESGHGVVPEELYGWGRSHYVWAIGAVQGTIVELGIGPAYNSLFSRALIKLLDGTPTTITLGGVDRLEITYELRQCINPADVPFSIMIGGTATRGVCRPSMISSCNGWGLHVGSAVGTSETLFYEGGALGAITASPSPGGSGSDDGYLLVPTANYVPGSHVRGYRIYLRWSAGDFTNISAIRCGGDWWWWPDCHACGGTWQFSLSPPVAKTSYEDFYIEFEYTWGRCA
jgi:hypothetical protein